MKPRSPEPIPVVVVQKKTNGCVMALAVLLGIVVLLVVAIAALGSSSTSTTGSVTVSPPEIVATEETTTPPPPVTTPQNATTFGDGTFEVGVDIQPGKYKVVAPDGCYWEKTDQAGEILDNENAEGPQVVIIEPTVFSFKSEDCGTWTKTG